MPRSKQYVSAKAKKYVYSIFILGLIIIPIIFIFKNSSWTNDNIKEYQPVDDTLVLVQVLFRHGEKTPTSVTSYPSDPYKNESYYHPYGYGQLINKGKETIYKLGKVLRGRYGKFLGPYKLDILQAKASYAARARMSLQVLLAGLFKPTASEKWTDEISWQPIDFEISPKDNLIFNYYSNCPNYMGVANNRLEDGFKNQTFKGLEELMKKLKKHTGWIHLNQTFPLYGHLKEQEDFGLKLPSWTNDIYPLPLKTLSEVVFYLIGRDELMKSTSGGFLLRDMVKNIDSKINPNAEIGKKLKMALYSGHDVTIVHLLGLLDLLEMHTVPYGAMVAVELHETNGGYFIKILYQKGPMENLTPLKLKNCNVSCSYEEFYRMFHKYLPMDGTCLKKHKNCI